MIDYRNRLRPFLGRIRIGLESRSRARAAHSRLAGRLSRSTVCVAIPVQNAERYLAAAIESVLAQEGVDVDVRVYDNCSTDRSVEIASSYPRVHVARNDEDINYYGSLNRALDETDAEYFVPFAADDLMLPDNLAIKVDALERFPAAFADSRSWLVDGSGRRSGVSDRWRLLELHMQGADWLARTIPANAVLCQSVVARTAVLRRIGGFDSRVVYCGDWLAWMLLALEHSVVTLLVPLIEQRLHTGSGTEYAARQGYFARDLPSALDRVLAHPACPPALAAHRSALLAEVYEGCAQLLERAESLRLTDGWAAYVCAGLALAEEPCAPERASRYRALVRAAGLAEPMLPLDAVAILGSAERAFAEMADAAEALHARGILQRLTVAAGPSVDRVPDYIDVVPLDNADTLLEPGRVALVPFGDAAIEDAERAGIPVFPYALPSPFEEPLDMRRRQSARFAR